MTPRPIFTSLTRIAGLRDRAFDVDPFPRETWETGDYVLGVVTSCVAGSRIEVPSGRRAEFTTGDAIVSALGKRFATLEVVGDWQGIEDDGRMEILSGGGILGRCTSKSSHVPLLPVLEYRGHLVADGAKVTMPGSVEPVEPRTYDVPTVLIVGTSMSAGKTTAARAVVRALARRGLDVLGAKLTGAGRRHDILAMADAGAVATFDFVDAGLPSTVVPAARYREALDGLLSRMAAAEPDVAVVEAGASPLEPYNGEAAMDALGDTVRCTILCASDPYAVLGVMRGFDDHRPDLVSGIAASTEGGIALVERLTGHRAVDLRDPATLDRIEAILVDRLGLEASQDDARWGVSRRDTRDDPV